MSKGGEKVVNVFAWIVFGLVAGVVANVIDPRPAKGGLVGAIILGIAGALVGGFLANLVFGVGITGFDINSFVIAVIGSLVLLFIGRSMRKI